MGAVGFICWMVKAAIVAYWAATAHDRNDVADPWAAAKFIVRGLTTAFIMFLFMKVNVRALPRKNPTERINHFLVPVVMLGIFSVFLETLIDQYVGSVDSTLRFVREFKPVLLLLTFLRSTSQTSDII